MIDTHQAGPEIREPIAPSHTRIITRGGGGRDARTGRRREPGHLHAARRGDVQTAQCARAPRPRHALRAASRRRSRLHRRYRTVASLLRIRASSGFAARWLHGVAGGGGAHVNIRLSASRGTDEGRIRPGAARLGGLLLLASRPDREGAPHRRRGRPPRGSGGPVAVIGDHFWKERLGGADVLGQSIVVGGTPATIVGIAPPGFIGAWSDAGRISGCR